MVDTNSTLQIVNIHKKYEGKPLLRGVSFEVASGEVVCLLGPSGSGKSTLLRIISDLENPEQGNILWQGQDISLLPVHLRNFSLMFQDYALFPHLSVWENVAFGLRMRNLPEEKIIQRVKETLKLVNMHKFVNRSVYDLSGGEQQRVALARALAPQPRLLMLDEPLGALDKTLKGQLSGELRTLLHRMGIPTIYVTHDQEEAFVMADSLVILHEGRISQAGRSEDIVGKPSSLWLANFLGLNNLLEGEITSTSPLKIKTSQGLFTSACKDHFQIGQSVNLILKAHDARIINPAKELNTISGEVVDVLFRGDGYSIKLFLGERKIIEFTSQKKLKIESKINVEFRPENVLCYARK